MLAIRRQVIAALATALDTAPKSVESALVRLPEGAFALSLKSTQFQEQGKKIDADHIARQLAASELRQFATIEAQRASIRVNLHPDSMMHAVIEDGLHGTDEHGVLEKSLSGQHVAIEFSSPNIAKPFHAGHLRSTIIGAYLSRLHAALGAKVTRINYVGDWGKQYGLLGVGFARHGSPAALHSHPIRHLYEVYVKINKEAESDPTCDAAAREYFTRLEQGGTEERRLWQQCRELSLAAFARSYERLGVTFDVVDAESLHAPAAPAVLAALAARGLVSQASNGAVVAAAGGGTVVLAKGDGATTYIVRDIAAAIARHDRLRFDRMLYVAGAEQSLHFTQLFELLRAAGHEWAARCEHVGFGAVTGMSTRRGTAVFLDDILDEAAEQMAALMAATPERAQRISDAAGTAQALGLAAVVVQDHRARRTKDYGFEWARMVQARGDTGPMMQYTHARLASLLELTRPDLSIGVQPAVLCERQARVLAGTLSRHHDALLFSLHTRDPAPFTQYVLQLCHDAGSAFEALPVRGASPSTAAQRALLFAATRRTLAAALRMLGLTPLDRV
eukprot:m.184636 g.184636  ORF g.184636 m.184636 type:complete len:562 (+) comp15392_c0_seq1:42-1727(+)